MRRKSNSSISKGISNIVIALVVMLSLGFLFAFTNGFTTELKRFYVQCNGTNFIGDYTNYNIEIGKEYKFKIVNTLSKSNKLEISVVPNTSVNDTLFEFYADNELRIFAYEDSITKGFEIKAYTDYFTFKASKDLAEILQLNYPDKAIINCPSAIDSGIPYFTLVIKSVDTEEEINISFNLITEQVDEW